MLCCVQSWGRTLLEPLELTLILRTDTGDRDDECVQALVNTEGLGPVNFQPSLSLCLCPGSSYPPC